MAPKTRYAQSGEVSIAYQEVGDGPIDLLFVPGFVSHLDLQWADPRIGRFLERLLHKVAYENLGRARCDGR